MNWLKKVLGMKTVIRDVIYTEAADMKTLAQKIHNNAVEKGFWKDLAEVELMKPVLKEEVYSAQYLNCVGQRLMLITSEVGEAEDALRKKDMENFREEIADIVIRCFDLAGGLDFDLMEEINKKHAYNLTRPYKHGKEF